MRIHHLALRVADLERSEAFYAGALGLTVERRLADEGGAPRSVWLRAGDALLMLEHALKVEAGPGQGSGHVLVFEADNLVRWEQTCVCHRLEVLDRTEHTLYVLDPDGHRVGLTVFPDARSS